MTDRLDDHDFAAALNWHRRSGNPAPQEARDLIAKLAQEVKRLRDREWMNMPDDAPSTYLGYPQPGAAPKHYGPDAVVVDGDWLVAQLEELTRLRREAELADLDF